MIDARIRLAALVAVIVLVADQATKALVEATMRPHQSIDLLPFFDRRRSTVPVLSAVAVISSIIPSSTAAAPAAAVASSSATSAITSSTASSAASRVASLSAVASSRSFFSHSFFAILCVC